MNPAFVNATSIGSTSLIPSTTKKSVCSIQSNAPINQPTITMRCRRDLKKEKSLRNLEFARAHRKRVIRRYNRRFAEKAAQDEDNAYLSSVFGTMRFGHHNSGGDESSK